ncbi:hypothetical protein LPJ61_003041 [Coemansia biformis]|uniref:Uncharacterized protein n=1 Tax=Coemansia biformis TaxID=1286918 RepID=A0A9W7YEL8_9FUNG|nr:hypothetical protein LPJ61_003041 [Coemansia biformis]
MYGYDADAESLRSLDSRASCESADSRVGLLSGYVEPAGAAVDGGPAHGDAALRVADLELIMAHQARMPCMGAQRVVLSGAKRRDMQMATLASTVGRMARLRYADQDCASVHDRRASDIEGFFDRLDRLAVDELSVQRFAVHADGAFLEPHQQQSPQRQQQQQQQPSPQGLACP